MFQAFKWLPVGGGQVLLYLIKKRLNIVKRIMYTLEYFLSNYYYGKQSNILSLQHLMVFEK